jgi:hypothetical protein
VKFGELEHVSLRIRSRTLQIIKLACGSGASRGVRGMRGGGFRYSHLILAVVTWPLCWVTPPAMAQRNKGIRLTVQRGWRSGRLVWVSCRRMVSLKQAILVAELASNFTVFVELTLSTDREGGTKIHWRKKEICELGKALLAACFCVFCSWLGLHRWRWKPCSSETSSSPSHRRENPRISGSLFWDLRFSRRWHCAV